MEDARGVGLLSPLADAEQWRTTPSAQDGICWALEAELRVYGCRLIQEAAMALRQSQRAAATAQVLFQRFWFVSSLRSFSVADTAQAALLLGTKLDEAPVRTRDLINVFDYALQRDAHTARTNPGPRARHLASLRRRRGIEPTSPAGRSPSGGQGTPGPDAAPPFTWSPPRYQQGSYLAQKDEVVVAEMQLLKRLAFRTDVALPYNTLANYLQLLGLTDAERYPGAAQMAWAVVNDALQTPVYCLFRAHAVACAAIYFTALFPPPGCPAGAGSSEQPAQAPGAPASRPPPPGHPRQIWLPYDPAPWYELLDVAEAELRAICAHLMALYASDALPLPAPAPRARPAARPRGVVEQYASDSDSDGGAAAAARTDDGGPALDAWARAAPHAGLASRVRDEWGGMAEFAQNRHLVTEYADLLSSLASSSASHASHAHTAGTER